MVDAQTTRVIRLYMYQPLIELNTDITQEEKEWQRRLKNTLQQKLWFSPFSGLNDPFERNFKLISNPKTILSNPDLLQMHFDFMKKKNIAMTTEQFQETLESSEFEQHLSNNRALTNHWLMLN